MGLIKYKNTLCGYWYMTGAIRFAGKRGGGGKEAEICAKLRAWMKKYVPTNTKPITMNKENIKFRKFRRVPFLLQTSSPL